MITYILRRLAQERLPVFYFHKVPLLEDPLYPQDGSLASFARTIEFIVENFRVVPLSEALDALLNQKKLPEYSACITFDDGYKGWFDRVIPVLLAHNAHATFYITTGQISGKPLWHERIYQVIKNFPAEHFSLPNSPLPNLSLGNITEKRRAIRQLEMLLKYRPLQERSTLLDAMEDLASVNGKSLPTISAEEIRAIHNKGFTIGGHTVNHPILTQCTETEATFEMGQCKETLEHITGAPVHHFAYPNGNPGKDYDASHIRIARHCGYQSAVSTSSGSSKNLSSALYQIPRFTPWGANKVAMRWQLARNLWSSNFAVTE